MSTSAVGPVGGGTAIYISIVVLILIWFYAAQQSGRFSKDALQYVLITIHNPLNYTVNKYYYASQDYFRSCRYTRSSNLADVVSLLDSIVFRHFFISASM